MTAPAKSLWEILVPTVKPNTDGKKYFRTRYHRVWDAHVRMLSGGLTIMSPSKGQWVSPCGQLFTERMIPVRVLACREDIEKIIDFTLEYYQQEAVLCYRISDDVLLRFSGLKNDS